jgi:hypothetical protein
MSEIQFECHKISEGLAEGEAIISTDDIMFYLIDPKTGIIIEKGHSLEGKSIAGKILIFPGGKGSSVVQADGMYQLAINNNAPKAMIIQYPDTVLVASAIIMEMPMVDRLSVDFYSQIQEGTQLRVDANSGKVSII